MTTLDCIHARASKKIAAYLARDGREGASEDRCSQLSSLSEFETPEPLGSWNWLLSLGDNDSVFVTLMELCISAAYKSRMATLLGEISPEGITLELALSILDEEFDSARLNHVYESACRLLYCRKGPLPFFRQPFSADDRLIDAVCGIETIDRRLAEDAGAELFFAQRLAPVYGARRWEAPLHYALECALDNSANIVVQFSGGAGSGKRLGLASVCDKLALPLLFIDYRKIAPFSAPDQQRMAQLILREAIFKKIGICFCHIDQELFPSPELLRTFYFRFILPLKDTPRLVCLLTSPRLELSPTFDQVVKKVELPAPDRGERIALWQGFSAARGLSLNCEEFGSVYKLSAAEIEKTVHMLSCERESAPSDGAVARACIQVLPPPSEGSVMRPHIPFTFDDLKIPETQMKNLQNICSQVRQRRRVFDDWGMESIFPYGKGVTALFVGPPGTGKTMAVYVLATELELPVYSINLSQVVDKYIGETEKRLESIFTAAEKSNAILFFDEADSLFGKRSEVKDAKDKYANTEVSYILSRIELYDGIVILATNWKKNIDEAFMRRMRYMVEFPLPNEATRLKLWRSSFTPDVPLDKIDFPYLARQFEFAGGAIKNIALNAAFLASDEQKPVGMSHIVSSIYVELVKKGKTPLRSDFAEYGHLFSNFPQ